MSNVFGTTEGGRIPYQKINIPITLSSYLSGILINPSRNHVLSFSVFPASFPVAMAVLVALPLSRGNSPLFPPMSLFSTGTVNIV
jgi:hypothetical protein